MRISVTGSFGTGKTSFAKTLSAGSIEIIEADREGKNLLVREWGLLSHILETDGEFNIDKVRTAVLDERIFRNYNEWMSRRLSQQIVSRIEHMESVIVDAALIIEWGIEKHFDRNILITDGDFESRMRRIAYRKPNVEMYKMLEKYQLTDEQKAEKCDIIIRNDGTLEEFEQKAESLRHMLFD